MGKTPASQLLQTRPLRPGIQSLIKTGLSGWDRHLSVSSSKPVCIQSLIKTGSGGWDRDLPVSSFKTRLLWPGIQSSLKDLCKPFLSSGCCQTPPPKTGEAGPFPVSGPAPSPDSSGLGSGILPEYLEGPWQACWGLNQLELPKLRRRGGWIPKGLHHCFLQL